MSINWLIDPLNTFAQGLLGYDGVLWMIARSHLLIAILIPLLGIGLARLPGTKVTKIAPVAFCVAIAAIYLYAEFFVGGVGPVCCIIHSDANWQSFDGLDWMGISLAMLIIIGSFRLSKTGDAVTRTLLSSSGWLAIVVLSSMLYFADQTYINGALVFAAEVVAASAIALLVGKLIGTHLSVKRRMHAMSNEKTDIKRDNPRHGTSQLVHHDDL